MVFAHFRFRPLGGSWSQLTIPGQATSFTLYNLQPNTDYEFMVLSRNDLGNGSFSDAVVARTLGKTSGAWALLPSGSFLYGPCVPPMIINWCGQGLTK